MNVPVIRVIMRAIAQILWTCTTVLVRLGGPAMFVTKVMYFKSSVASPTSRRNPSKPLWWLTHTAWDRNWERYREWNWHNIKQWLLIPVPIWDLCEHFCILEPIDPGTIPVSFPVPVFQRSGISQCNYFLSGWTCISQTFDSGPLFVLLGLRILALAHRV